MHFASAITTNRNVEDAARELVVEIAMQLREQRSSPPRNSVKQGIETAFPPIAAFAQRAYTHSGKLSRLSSE
jgi:hypothetical protein